MFISLYKIEDICVYMHVMKFLIFHLISLNFDTTIAYALGTVTIYFIFTRHTANNCSENQCFVHNILVFWTISSMFFTNITHGIKIALLKLLSSYAELIVKNPQTT